MNTDDKLIAILKGCLKNKRSSQKELYQHFYAYGMSIGLRYSGSEDEAVMILNDGFMKVFKYLKNFDLDKPFKPWFRRIIVNTAIDHYNVAAKQPLMDDVEEVNEPDRAADVISGISYQEIVGLMAQLPPSYRAVFNLYVIEGFSHEEIADKLGVSIGTTKSNLFKAKRKMKEMLEELFEVS
ncbi:MAG: RNA polymerase sigma factor [Cytophagales bacterium]|nr:RNA polymerase sigma factor [Cytophagales bacterium]